MVGGIHNKIAKRLRDEAERKMMRGWSEAWERAGDQVRAERDAMARRDVFCECGRSATFWLHKDARPVFKCAGCGAVHRE